MLKLGTLRWKGRCSRHPQYDPNDGEGAIRGACQRCYALLEIYEHHRRLMELMRAFGPVRDRRNPSASEELEARQTMFDFATNVRQGITR